MVELSSSDAEYVALEIGKEHLHRRQDQQFITPNVGDVLTKSFEGKPRSMKLANKPVSCKRMQLIFVKHHFMRDAVLENIRPT